MDLLGCVVGGTTIVHNQIVQQWLADIPKARVLKTALNDTTHERITLNEMGLGRILYRSRIPITKR